MLPAICRAWDLSPDACGALHEAFITAFEVGSTAFMDDDDFYNYIDSLHGLLVVEFGTTIPHINEPDCINELDMKTFLSLYK
jgi:hypothetical protein